MFSTSQNAFEKRLFPARNLMSKPLERSHGTSIEPSEYLGWAFLKPQRPMRRNRTICDFSAHIKYCQDEEMLGGDFPDRTNYINPKSIPLNGPFDSDWLLPKSVSMNDFSSHMKYCFDDGISILDDQITGKFDKISFTEENFQKFSYKKEMSENSQRREHHFISLDDTILNSDEMTSCINSMQHIIDDPLRV